MKQLSTGSESQMPTIMCPLSGAQNVASARFWKCKVLKSHYFSPIGITGLVPNAPTDLHLKGQVHQTYSQKHWHVKVKSNSVITIADSDGLGGIINYREVPMKKQSWLMFRTSISERDISTAYTTGGAIDHVTPGSLPYQRLAIQISKTVSHRDSVGASP